MAIYKLGSNKNKQGKRNIKKVVGFSLIGVASLVFLFMTGIVPAIRDFFLGLFGVFGYPLCIVLMVVGLALVNNRRYVMSKKYTICLCMAVFFFLCLLQLIIVGGKFVEIDGQKTALSFGEYLAKNYLKVWTAGGFVIGFFTTCLLYLTTIYGAYIIFALGLVLCFALLLDSLNFLKKEKQAKMPVAVQIKDKKPTKVLSAVQTREPAPKVKAEKQQPENVVLNGNLKEEEEKEAQKPLTARQILGLDKKRNSAYAIEAQQPVRAKKVEESKPKTRKEYILTPPQIDLDEFFKDLRKQEPSPSKQDIQSNVQLLKDDEIKQPLQNETEKVEEVEQANQTLQPQNFEQQQEMQPLPSFEKALPQVQAEELVAHADEILLSAIEEEKEENAQLFEDLAQEAEKNVLDGLPTRDNGGSFAARDNFSDRERFENFERSSFQQSEQVQAEDVFERESGQDFRRRSDFGGTHNSSGRDYGNSDGKLASAREGFAQSLRAREEKNMSAEDLDARRTFNSNREQFNMRNGSFVRENEPIEKEEEEKPREPYFYEKPPMNLITTQSVDLSTLNEDVAVKRVLLENTLETFGVPAKVQGVMIGPAVTRYELEMPQGISVQKIKNRGDDIALSLAAEGTIRIEAPIPGKSVVGIEVPNSSIATISLKDVLTSKEFQQAPSPLTFALGKDIAGRTICTDMRKLTHLLVAGSTGSGKSVCLNSIILSIIYKASPEDVKVLLIDPKRVEFATYEGLPHLVTPYIISDTQKAINALAWAVNEMERRFDVLSHARVKEISDFNQTPDVLSGKVQKMPYLVIIVDELADLMMTGKKEVEEKVCRLAQKARAAGIHLILATQRPSVDVITGLIKSNFPSRISFAVTSAVDSMTILDRVGAEKLLGKGDMFYFPYGAKDPSRVQGCFISGNEINQIVDYVRDNNLPIFDDEITQAINNPNKNAGNGGAGYNNEMDELLPQALKVSIECGQASATMIRRKFAIGYPRAARIIDQMEEAGYISSADGAKGRSVYISEDEFHAIFGDIYD